VFDYRYHALSIVAVFVALLLGLLLGVAVGDKGLVSSAERDLRGNLRKEVRNAQAERDKARGDLQDRDRFEQQQLYPLLVQGRLSNQRVGLIALGCLPNSTIGHVQDALKDTGGRLTLEAVVREPVQLDGISRRDSGAPRGKSLTQDPKLINRFGRQFGVALAEGGRLVQRVRRSLLTSSSGSLGGMDAVVLVREDPGNRSDTQARIDGAFEAGLIAGLTQNNVPVVGAELSSTQPSQISWYARHNLSSVDSIDRFAGRVALVFTLTGASGSYGIKSTAKALLPNTVGGAGPR
jgi:hypothetical protein